MAFCILEKDKKTFEYFKQYVRYLEHEDNTCLILDNLLQKNEIQMHLELNGVDAAQLSERKKNEISDWIEKNAQPFRDYLNTIKLVYVVWKCMGRDWKNISWDDYITIGERLNQLKANCLDTIF